jgi:hypothetical protein
MLINHEQLITSIDEEVARCKTSKEAPASERTLPWDRRVGAGAWLGGRAIKTLRAIDGLRRLTGGALVQ